MSLSPLQITGPHHIGISVSNMENSLAWYAEHLGFVKRSETYIAERELRIVYIARDGFEIELFEKVGSSPQRSEESDPKNYSFQGYRHFSFLVDDVDATFADLKARGLDVVVEPGTNDDLGVRFCFIKDPDGVLIEFLRPV